MGCCLFGRVLSCDLQGLLNDNYSGRLTTITLSGLSPTLAAIFLKPFGGDMAVTKQQVGVYMSSLEKGLPQATSAAKAGFSERTGRRIMEQGGHSLSRTPRHWRTRSDPFAQVWDSELVPLLRKEGALQAITLLEYLQQQDPERYPDKLLRTLQRRVKMWRVLEGPGKEVMFRQTHEPGQMGLSDFTHLKGVTITIRGQALTHKLYHFRLAYSGWCDVKVILGGESYTALAEGLQHALAKLGGVPNEHRTDSLSAAFKNLSQNERVDITARYKAFCEHYDMVASRNNPGHGHENGSIESPHGHLKQRIRQALLMMGSYDFDKIEDYQSFLNQVSAKINRRNKTKVAAELLRLKPTPAQKAADYTEVPVRVTSSSTINVSRMLYTVPDRLIGERLLVHLFDDRLVFFHGIVEVLRLARAYPLPGKRRGKCVDYRHIIDWLVKKPMAFKGLQFRDELLPTEDWRRIWSHLSRHLEPRQACKLIVGALKLAADYKCETDIAAHFLVAIEHNCIPGLPGLQKLFGKKSDPVPKQNIKQHDLSSYDVLIRVNMTKAPDLVEEEVYA